VTVAPRRPAAGPSHRSPSLGVILTPKWRTALARLRQERSDASPKYFFLALVAVGFWAAAFGVFYRVLRYVYTQQEIGAVLAAKILGVILLAFASMLLLSNLITALSSFFLARDLDILVAAPVDWLHFYVAKLLETIVNSSWMVVLIAFPIFTAYGVVFHGGFGFPLVAIGAMVPYVVLPAVLGTAVTMVLVNVFPARRTRDLLSLVAIGAAGGLVLVLRLIRPEQLAKPDGVQNLLQYLSALRTPANPFLPSEWAARMVMNWLLQIADPLPVILLWTTAPAFVVLGALLHQRLYTAGYSKAQEGANTATRRGGWEWPFERLLRGLSPSKREFILKDLRVFFRDTQQWSQLILLAVLLIVYLFNIRSLPLFSGERTPVFLITLVVFLNQGLAGFVLAAIAARFIFPAVSLEGRQMWLLRSSPLDLRALLWSKYWTGTTPLLALAMMITVTTNLLLRASPFMMAISLGTVFCLTLAISALALGYGALYPRFDSENTAQIPTSLGGLLFMMTSIVLLGIVIVIEALPVMTYLRAQLGGAQTRLDARMVLALAAVVAICAAATIIPLRLGLRRMEEMEF
jgi:ABC-2 type transport system permease protein